MRGSTTLSGTTTLGSAADLGLEGRGTAPEIEPLGFLLRYNPPQLILHYQQAAAHPELDDRAARGASIGQNLKWWPIDFRQQDLVAKLRNGESIEEWFARRPENVHRCVCAPRVFPSTIAAVGAWQARLAGGSIAMLCVYALDEGIEPRVFVSPRPMESSTQAQQSASVMAHAYISELVEAKASERA